MIFSKADSCAFTEGQNIQKLIKKVKYKCLTTFKVCIISVKMVKIKRLKRLYDPA